jgi:hypothetical protein
MSNQQNQPVEMPTRESHVDRAVEPSHTKQPPRQARRGAGFLEALVSLCVVISIAGITMPIIADEQAENRLEQSVVGMQNILDGIRNYSEQTHFLPTGNRGRTDVTWLYGPGELPRGIKLGNVSHSRSLNDILLNDSMAGSAWQGPYGDPAMDPWGRSYLVNVDGLVDPRRPSWILTAGPDGVMQTPASAQKAAGDDILLPIN